MLLNPPKKERSLSKIEPAAILKANHNTAQKSRMAYFEQEIDGLLFVGRLGTKPILSTRDSFEISVCEILSKKYIILKTTLESFKFMHDFYQKNEIKRLLSFLMRNLG